MCVYQIGMGRDAKGAVVLHARQMSPLSGCSLGFLYFSLCSCVVVVVVVVVYFFFLSVVRLFSSFYFSVLFRLWLLFNIFDDDDASSAIPLSWNRRNALKHSGSAYRCNPWQRCRIDPFYFLFHISPCWEFSQVAARVGAWVGARAVLKSTRLFTFSSPSYVRNCIETH